MLDFQTNNLTYMWLLRGILAFQLICVNSSCSSVVIYRWVHSRLPWDVIIISLHAQPTTLRKLWFLCIAPRNVFLRDLLFMMCSIKLVPLICIVEYASANVAPMRTKMTTYIMNGLLATHGPVFHWCSGFRPICYIFTVMITVESDN